MSVACRPHAAWGRKVLRYRLHMDTNMDVAAKLATLLSQLNTVIVGKEAQVRDCVACLLAGGHLLIEDVPGVGKTTLAHALSHTFGLQFSRVQFTADLMPGDLSGVAIYDRGQQAFVFHPGPIFAQVLLADEINRASPKTQSALLEAMEEKQVTVEGETRPLPSPFFVIATQNPQDQLGTFALPESQLDRFLMRISLGYPDRAAERQLLAGADRREMLASLPAMLTAGELTAIQQRVQQVHASDALLNYVQDLIAATRSGRWFLQCLSPRAGIAVQRAAKAQSAEMIRAEIASDDPVQKWWRPLYAFELTFECAALWIVLVHEFWTGDVATINALVGATTLL
eukprot:gene1401-1875_t